MTDTQQAPIDTVRPQEGAEPRVTDERVLSLLLDGDPITYNASGIGQDERTFRPERLLVKWKDGELVEAFLDGKRLRKNGDVYATGAHERMGLANYRWQPDGTTNPLHEWVPQWLVTLIARYTPPTPAR